MIAYLSGKIIMHRSNWIIIDTGSIGYKVFVLPTAHYDIGENYSLYTHEYIREDRDDLYGFNTLEELEIFEILISVSGLGPKIGLMILSTRTKSEIEKAIELGDVKVFQSVKGIGKKLAAKIILELKNKLDISQLDNLSGDKSVDLETENALMALGYKKQEIQPMLKKLPKNIKTLDNKVKWVLKNNR
jgi:Holliday junction DNA helicase RuvA